MAREYRFDDTLPESARLVADWMESYLGAPDRVPEFAPLRPRKNYICPFIPPAFRKNSVVFVVDEDATSPDETERRAVEYIEKFHRIPPMHGPEVKFKAVVLIFPRVGEATARAAIDEVQAALKTWVIFEHGMMIGEMHPACDTPAKGDDRLFPNRSPVPLLALRSIVGPDMERFLKADLPFDQLSVEQKIQQLEYHVGYLRAAIRCATESQLGRERTEWEREIEETLAERERLTARMRTA